MAGNRYLNEKQQTIEITGNGKKIKIHIIEFLVYKTDQLYLVPPIYIDKLPNIIKSHINNNYMNWVENINKNNYPYKSYSIMINEEGVLGEPIEMELNQDYKSHKKKKEHKRNNKLVIKKKKKDAQCIVCHIDKNRNKGKMSKCSRCKTSKYCSKHCQKIDWKLAHRLVCHLNEC